MNKFWKVCLIVTGVMAGAGLFIALCGAAFGGLEQAVYMVENGSFNLGNGRFYHDIDIPGSLDDNWELLEDYVQISDGEHPVMSADSYRDDKVAWKNQVTRLSAKLGGPGGARFSVLESDTEYFQIEANDTDYFQYYVEDGELVIRVGRKREKHLNEGFEWDNRNEIVLLVPKGTVFQEAELEVIGILDIINLHADVLEVDGVGEVRADGIYSEDAEISLGAGRITVENGNAGFLSADVGMGEFTYQGHVEKGLDVNCGMGAANIMLDGTELDHNYNISGGAGSIRVGDTDYSGVLEQKYIDNQAGNEFSLRCGMGQIVLEFTGDLTDGKETGDK